MFVAIAVGPTWILRPVENGGRFLHRGGTFLPRELTVQRRFAGRSRRFGRLGRLARPLLCIDVYELVGVVVPWFVVSPDGAFTRGVVAGGLSFGMPVTQEMV